MLYLKEFRPLSTGKLYLFFNFINKITVISRSSVTPLCSVYRSTGLIIAIYA